MTAIADGAAFQPVHSHRPPGQHTRDRLRPSKLRHIVATVAANPELWAHLVHYDLTERFATRLHLSESFEVWLICWDLGQDTLLHDHGGSVGAFAVASGTLLEDFGSTRSASLRTRLRVAGESACFGSDYVHNLVNASSRPAVSIHAYSAPLTRMDFYCWLPTGLHYLRSIPCDDGEPDTTELERISAALRASLS